MLSKTLQEDFEYLYAQQLPWNYLNDQCVLVTGGTGLLGSYLLKYMDYLNQQKGHTIRLVTLVRNQKKALSILQDVNVMIVTADLLTSLQLSLDVDFIFHCAAITKSIEMAQHPVEVFESIVIATNHILKLAAKKKLRSMVYLSSMEIYGQPDSCEELVTENVNGYIDLLNCRSCYPLAKRMAENLCFDYVSEYQVPVKIARLAQTFGAGVLPGENRVFAQFARSASFMEDIVLHTDGSSQGNYCDIADAALALFFLLLKGENGQAYNIANESACMSIREMAELVANKIANGKIKIKYEIPETNKFGYAAPVKMKLSSDKLRKLGWTPRFGLEDMYRRMLNDLFPYWHPE